MAIIPPGGRIGILGGGQLGRMLATAAAELGLAIPRDISVVGFDDHRLFSEGLRPALTTVALPYVQMGNVAVGVLLDEKKELTVPKTKLIEGPLIVRQSTGSPSDT